MQNRNSLCNPELRKQGKPFRNAGTVFLIVLFVKKPVLILCYTYAGVHS